jgi:hypothetical protein
VHGRALLDRLVDEREQALRRDIGDVLEPDPPESLGTHDLHSDRDDRLGLRLAPADTALQATDVPLVDLDVTAQPLTMRTNHRDPIAMQHRPRGLVRAQPERALNPQRRDPVLLTGHLPCRREPQLKWGPSAMKDRPRGHRRLPTRLHTPSDRYPAATRPGSRSADSGSRPASATTPGSPGTPRRPGTTTAAQRTSPDTLDQPPAPLQSA